MADSGSIGHAENAQGSSALLASSSFPPARAGQCPQSLCKKHRSGRGLDGPHIRAVVGLEGRGDFWLPTWPGPGSSPAVRDPKTERVESRCLHSSKLVLRWTGDNEAPWSPDPVD